MTDLVELLESYELDTSSPWTDNDHAALKALLDHVDHLYRHGPEADPTHDPVTCPRAFDRAVVDEIGRAEWVGIREAADLSIAELARQLEVDATNISRYEGGTRWPEAQPYLTWLRETDRAQALQDRNTLFVMQCHRDGWFDTGYDDTPESVRRHWDALFAPGGLYTKWQETGNLPAWTPRDAGLGPA